jgi:hypothetical protein
MMDKSLGGTDDPSNLRAEAIGSNSTSASIGSAEPLKWLISKFPEQAADQLIKSQ